MTKAFLITGTDTGIGKTFIGRCLIKTFKEMGLKVAPFKPVETGVEKGIPQDAMTLLEESGLQIPIEMVVPYCFEEPCAPLVASRKEKTKISITKIIEAYSNLIREYELVIVESAGGLLVPITENITYAELAKLLNVPILIVARSKLGTINHTLLTLRVAQAYGIKVISVVLNQFEGSDYAEKNNPDIIEELSGTKVFTVQNLKEPKPLKDLGRFIYENITDSEPFK